MSFICYATNDEKDTQLNFDALNFPELPREIREQDVNANTAWAYRNAENEQQAQESRSSGIQRVQSGFHSLQHNQSVLGNNVPSR